MHKPSSFDIMAFLPYLLNQAAEQTSLEFKAHYQQRYGMLRTEWRVLFHLGKLGEITANEIVVAAKIHKTKISRAVQALVKKGFVKRTQDVQDRRRELLILTKKGMAAFEDLCGLAQTYEEQLVSKLSANEIRILRTALTKLMAT